MYVDSSMCLPLKQLTQATFETGHVCAHLHQSDGSLDEIPKGSSPVNLHKYLLHVFI